MVYSKKKINLMGGFAAGEGIAVFWMVMMVCVILAFVIAGATGNLGG